MLHIRRQRQEPGCACIKLEFRGNTDVDAKLNRVNAEYKLLTPQKPAQLLDVQLIRKWMST